MSSTSSRKRSRNACEPCRERKRKCDGVLPCGTCVRFEYACSFAPSPRKKSTSEVGVKALKSSGAASFDSAAFAPLAMAPATPKQSLEANSGTAFVRQLGLGLDPVNAPRLHAFAWNVFLRDGDVQPMSSSQTLLEVLSLDQMNALTATYFNKIDPAYGFIKKHIFETCVAERWSSSNLSSHYDAVICGVAALACLFSSTYTTDLEHDLLDRAKSVLERSLVKQPNLESIQGWVLRVAYLRMAALSHEAWMASCTTMHLIEAAGLDHDLHSKTNTNNDDIDIKVRQRVCGVAQHLNTWISFDIGRSRVDITHNRSNESTYSRPEDYTDELLGLLQLSQDLDPHTSKNAADLANALSTTLARAHTIPPTILAQCNLVLCICRRLKLLDHNLSGHMLTNMLLLVEKAIAAVHQMCDTYQPWHHAVNVPFQIICIMLAIDTPATIVHLNSAMKCLYRVQETFGTAATQEALTTACSLISIHQKRKHADAKALEEIARQYAPPLQEKSPSSSNLELGYDSSDWAWMEHLIPGMTNSGMLDLDECFAASLEYPV